MKFYSGLLTGFLVGLIWSAFSINCDGYTYILTRKGL